MVEIRLGPAGSGGYASSTLEGVQKLPELGLSAIEIEFVRGVNMGIPLARQIGAEAKKQDIKLSIHSPYYINLASKEKLKIQQSKKRILDSCERMHHMGGGPVVFHPSYFGGQDKERVFQITREAILDMMAEVKKNGWKSRLAPETTGKHSALGSLEETIRLVRETGCFLCVDPAHLFARGYGRLDFREMFSKLRPLKLKHLHFHFSGIEYTAKGEKNHVVLGESGPDFKKFAEELLKQRWLESATVISETPDTWKGSLKMKEILEDLGHEF